MASRVTERSGLRVTFDAAPWAGCFAVVVTALRASFVFSDIGTSYPCRSPCNAAEEAGDFVVGVCLGDGAHLRGDRLDRRDLGAALAARLGGEPRVLGGEGE